MMKSDDETAEVVLILVVLTIYRRVQILGVKDVSKLAHHFCISFSARKCSLLPESDI